MNPGKLRHRIILQAPGTTENELGEEVIGYVDLKTIWANVEPLKGLERLEAMKKFTENMFRITMRYTKGLTTDMKVKLKDGRILEIQNIINVEERNIEMQLMCMEIEK